jgi:predicted RNA methylase
MMIKPDKIEYTIGKDRHGRTVKLVHENVSGQVEWRIVSEPASQRDQVWVICSLTKENLIAMGEIAKSGQ